jgi:hypothetical protein
VHVFPARVVLDSGVLYPVTAEQSAGGDEVYIDARHGEWRRTITNATMSLSDDAIRTSVGTERVWTVHGLLDGEPTTALVIYARGCGCGSTSTVEPNADQRALLALAENQ